MNTDNGNATNCTGALFSEHQLMILGITQAACALVSCLGCCFIFFIMIIFKKYVYSSQRLIMYLTVAVLLLSISYIIRGAGYKQVTPSPFCEAIAFFSMYSGACILVAVVCVMVDMFNRSEILCSEPLKLEKLYIPAIFVAPALLDWIPFMDHAYGPTETWCWIRSIDLKTCDTYIFGVSLQYGLWFVPLYITIVVGIVVYTVIVVCARKKSKRYSAMLDFDKKEAYQATIREVKLFFMIPAAYFLINLVPFIARIINDVKPNVPLFGLWVAAALVQGLQGVFLTLLVALDPETRKRITTWTHVRSAYRHNILNGSDAQEYKIFVNDGDSKQSDD